MDSDRDSSGNKDAEKGIILGMLHYSDVRRGSALALDPLLFTDSLCGRLFSVLSDLGDREEIDRVILRDGAKANGINEDLSYLFEEQPPNRDILRSYYEIVKDRGGMQALASLAQKISSETEKTEESAFDISEKVLDELGRIRAVCAPLSADIHTMRQPVERAMKSMEQCFVDKKGIVSGIPTGFRELDKILTGLNPGIILIGARPYLGMQDLAMNIALNVSRQNKVLYAASSTSEDLFTRNALTILSGLSRPRIQQGCTSRVDFGKLTEAAAMLASNRGLYLANEVRNADELFKQASFLKGRQGLDLVIVDTFQDLLPELTDYRNSGFLAQQTARPIEKLYTNLGLPVIVLSELSSDVDKRARTTRPRVGHIRDYGALEYRAHQIILLHDENFDGEETVANRGVKLHVDVNKHGFTGTVVLNYDAENAKFTDRSYGIDDSTLSGQADDRE